MRGNVSRMTALRSQYLSRNVFQFIVHTKMINRFGPSPETPGGASVSYPVPNPVDLVVIEQVGARPENYEPLPIDSPHPDNALTGLDLRLVWQGPTPSDPTQMRRVYAGPRTSQDVYNYALQYSEQSNAAPIYVRTYLERRDTYTSRTKGQPLTGVTGLRLTAAGTGYVQETTTVSISGSGTGATAVAKVRDGQIIGLYLTDEGTGYTTTPTVTINGDGSGATATGSIQPQSAVLVKEDVQKIEDDVGEIRWGWHEQMMGGTYVKVIRTYETLPGPVTTSTAYERDGVKKTVTKQRMLKASTATNESLATNLLTRNFSEWIDDVVANQVTELITVDSDSLLDDPGFTVSIPDIIPPDLRAQIPQVVTSHILKGTATEPTLAAQEFEHSQKQLTKLYYEERITKIASDLPVTVFGKEITEEYGGGVLNTALTLAANPPGQSVDQGLYIVESKVTPLGNAMDMKFTKFSAGTSWFTISGSKFDREMQVFVQEDHQIVDPSYTPLASGHWVERVEPISVYRSRRIRTTRAPTAISLATALVEEVDGPYQFPGLVYAVTGGYYRRQASAQLCQHTLRTWWLNSVSKPTRGLPGSGADVEVQDIVMDDIIISALNNVTTLEYSGMALHDAITTFATFVYAATVPSATAYRAMIGTEIVVAASIEPTEIPFQWKIQTKSVVAR
jgi:hypothetical protein